MSSVFSNKIAFWGGVVSLSVLITGSCYYLLSNLTVEDKFEESNDNLNDLLLTFNGQITEEIAVQLMIKIEQLAELEYLKDNENTDKKRRAINNYSSEEYMQLCQETLMKKQYANQLAAEKVLSQFKHRISFEELNTKIRQIAPEKLETLSLTLYTPFENEILPSVDIAKEAYIYYTTSFLSEMESLNMKYQNSPNADIDQQLIELMMLKLRIDDQIYTKYKTNDRLARIVLGKEHKFITDPDLKELKERMKMIEEMA